MTGSTEAVIWNIDWREPSEAFAPFAGVSHAHLLRSGVRSHEGEWSIIVAFPADVLSVSGEAETDDAFPALQSMIDERAIVTLRAPAEFPFVSGFLGFVGYEAARFIEPSLRLPLSPFALPGMAFGYYEAAALFSHRDRRAYVVGRNANACAKLRDALGDVELGLVKLPVFEEPSSNFSAQGYQAAVAEAIENILDGDYYQANLSQRLMTKARDAFCSHDLFRILVDESDASFAALLQYPQGDILSNSPERFFRVTPSANGVRHIVTEPVKGTRPRDPSPAKDAALAAALANDKKDRAENIMIADLMRNDLSRICEDKSVREEAICELRSYANVHHLVSRISGVLRSGISVSDIFSALFPCGSITGAPKLAAMEAIARIEGVGRGPYCGAIGYIDDRGGADFSVAIRTMITSASKKEIAGSVGGGITLQSDPYKEYIETIDKSKDSLAALGVRLGAL